MPFLCDYPQIKIIQDIAKKKKVSIFLVGGFLRDYLLGRSKMDFDFAVEKNALKIARLFADKIKGAYVLLDRKRGCARVVKKDKGKPITFDFADFRAGTFRQDLSRRDFTINTFSVDLGALDAAAEIEDVLADYKKGLGDIRSKRIKRVSAKAFQDDPLRMMRAFSLSAALGFKIERETLAQIKMEKDLIKGASYERIRDELFKVLESPRAAATLKAMDRTGLLENIVPQISVMYGCRQGTYHHLSVWPHSLETVAQIEKIFKQTRKDREVDAYLGEKLAGEHSRRAVLKLASLLHDIGKPGTRKKEQGRVSFHGHEHAGKGIVRHVAKILKLSTRERHILEDMVRWHLRPGYLSNFKKPSEKAVYRYFRDTKNEAASILLLSLADQRSTRGPATTAGDQRHHEKICLELIGWFFKKKNEQPFIPLINGNDLIEKLKMKPSPVFGKILSEVREQQSLGKIKSKEEALALARKISLGK